MAKALVPLANGVEEFEFTLATIRTVDGDGAAEAVASGLVL
jgi:hypothetical protein